jgi:hypothetical protein
MDEEMKSSVQTQVNEFMEIYKKYQKSTEERIEAYRRKHIQFVSDSVELKKFYHDVVRLDTWLLSDEAIPYCVGVEPSQWHAIEPLYQQFSRKLNSLIKAGTVVTLNIVNPEAKEKKWRVMPKEFVQWLHSKGIRPRKELEESLGLQYRDDKKNNLKITNHQNTEVNAQKREQILFAALSVLARWPEECTKKNGKISAAAITNLIEQKSNIWFGYDELPMTTRGMTLLISKALKKTLG